VPDEFHGDETLLTFHETLSFSLFVMLAKVIVFNVTKSSMKLPLRLALVLKLAVRSHVSHSGEIVGPFRFSELCL